MTQKTYYWIFISLDSTHTLAVSNFMPILFTTTALYQFIYHYYKNNMPAYCLFWVGTAYILLQIHNFTTPTNLLTMNVLFSTLPNIKLTFCTEQLITMLFSHLNQYGITLESSKVKGSAPCLVCVVHICSTIQQALGSLHSSTKTRPPQGSETLPVLPLQTGPCNNSRANKRQNNVVTWHWIMSQNDHISRIKKDWEGSG